MRNKLQFKNFLKRYCKYLTSSPDYRLTSFSKELNNNHRAMPAVMLYSLETGRQDDLFKRLPEDMKTEYRNLLLEFEKYKNLADMCENSDDLPMEFKKVYMAYKATFDRKQDELVVKKMYKNLFNDLLKKNKVSKYKVCKDNNLVQSNLNKFLNGSLGCLSLKKCRMLDTYLDNL